jgi:hypothetical protein
VASVTKMNDYVALRNDTGKGKPKYPGGGACPIATLSTAQPVWTGRISNQGRRVDRLQNDKWV